MTDESVGGPEQALEAMITAARAHLAAVQAAEGAIDDDQVWQTYVALNNASFEYDQLLLDTYGEVTPWDTERIDPQEAEMSLRGPAAEEPEDDPYPAVVSVRQRRDFRVPSVSALLAAATQAVGRIAGEEGHELAAPESVAEAVLGLVQAGEGSLSPLDLPVLEPLDGIVTVVETERPLDLSSAEEGTGAELFALGPGDRVVGRLDEHPYLELDDELVDGIGDELAGEPDDQPGDDGRGQ